MQGIARDDKRKRTTKKKKYEKTNRQVPFLYKNRIKSTCPVARDMAATAADVIGQGSTSVHCDFTYNYYIFFLLH